MTLLQLFNLEPAPIYGQYVRRVSPLGAWERAEQQRGESGFVSAYSPEFLEGIRCGRITKEDAMAAGMSSSRFYRIRKWGPHSSRITQLTDEELDRVGTVSHR